MFFHEREIYKINNQPLSLCLLIIGNIFVGTPLMSVMNKITCTNEVKNFEVNK